jgi:hypothetical protein
MRTPCFGGLLYIFEQQPASAKSAATNSESTATAVATTSVGSMRRASTPRHLLPAFHRALYQTAALHRTGLRPTTAAAATLEIRSVPVLTSQTI